MKGQCEPHQTFTFTLAWANDPDFKVGDERWLACHDDGLTRPRFRRRFRVEGKKLCAEGVTYTLATIEPPMMHDEADQPAA